MSSLQRWILFFAATAVQSAGIALVVKSLLGTSPISSLPYVMSLNFPFTLGQTTFAVNMVFVVGQILLLRRDFKLMQLLQVPATLVFALGIDFFMFLFAPVRPENYLEAQALLLIGTTLISFGVAGQGIADVLMLAGEGIVYAVARYFSLDFGRVKVGNDVLLVLIAALLSLYETGTIEGIREGTLISALITGIIARFFLRHLGRVNAQGRLEWSPHLCMAKNKK